MVKIIFLSAALLGAACPGASAEGTTGGQFLRIGVGAKATALGETGATITGAQSMFYNPAGLAAVTGTEFVFSQVKWIMDVNYSNLALVKGNGDRAYGLAVNYLSLPSIGKYDKYGNSLGESYSVSDMAVAFGYARRLTPRKAWGADVKYISSRLESESATAFAADAGVSYSAVPGTLETGFALQNLGSRLKYVSAGDPLPLNARLGGRYLIRLTDNTGDKNRQNVSVLADLNSMKGAGFYANLGLELQVNYVEGTLCALRAGYKTQASGSAGGISFGFGLEMAKYTVDYAFSSMGELGQAHRLSLTMRFDSKFQPSRSEAAAPAPAPVTPAAAPAAAPAALPAAAPAEAPGDTE